jgi:hypothetical protein
MSEHYTSPSPRYPNEAGDFWRQYMDDSSIEERDRRNKSIADLWEQAVAEGFQLHGYQIIPPPRSRRVNERFAPDGIYYGTEALPSTYEDIQLQFYRDKNIKRLENHVDEGNVKELPIPQITGHDLLELERVALTQAGIVPTESAMPLYAYNAYRAIFVRWPDSLHGHETVVGKAISINKTRSKAA